MDVANEIPNDFASQELRPALSESIGSSVRVSVNQAPIVLKPILFFSARNSLSQNHFPLKSDKGKTDPLFRRKNSNNI